MREAKFLLLEQGEDEFGGMKTTYRRGRGRCRCCGHASPITMLVCVLATALLTATVSGVWAGLARSASTQPTLNYRTPATENTYVKSTVVTDSTICSHIGQDILTQGGSAVDAAIAALVCLGVTNPHTSGLGGGFVMVVYDKKKNNAVNVLDALPSTPENMTTYTTGGSSILVPGQLHGYAAAWRHYGKLPWKKLFQPSVKLAREGIKIQEGLARAIGQLKENTKIRSSFSFSNGTLMGTNKTVVFSNMADTLEAISNQEDNIKGKNINVYGDALAKSLIRDIADQGGNITLSQLLSYRRLWRNPVTTRLKYHQMNIYSPPPPTSGAIFQFLMNIMDGFDFGPVDIDTQHNVRTYHRLIEAFKFGSVFKSKLFDPHSNYTHKLLKNLTLHQFADYVGAHIVDSAVSPAVTRLSVTPGTKAGPWPGYHTDSGSTHVGVLSEDGMAVSVTASLNGVFGSKRIGRRTGVVFNNHLEGFSEYIGARKNNPTQGTHAQGSETPPRVIRTFELAPNSRAPSHLCPSILLDHHNLAMVIGASGGSHTTAAAAFVATHNLWLGLTLKEATDMPRVLDDVNTKECVYESTQPPTPEELLSGLRRRGHALTESRDVGVVNSIRVTHNKGREKSDNIRIDGCSDGRGGGQPSGT